jgi:two-component system, OmpR family, phosphate regulon sensor histidine kinase PhoR
MKRKFIIGLTLLLSLALLGIVLVQLLWIRRAFNENEQRFDRNVSEVLDKVADRLEKQENMSLLGKRMEVKYLDGRGQGTRDEGQGIKDKGQGTRDEGREKGGKGQGTKDNIPVNSGSRNVAMPKEIHSSTVIHSGHIDKHIKIIRNDNSDTNSKIILWVNDSNTSSKKSYTYTVITRFNGDSVMTDITENGIKTKIRKRKEDLNKVFNQMANEITTTAVPLRVRVPKEVLEKETRKFLDNKGINIPFEYAVISDKHDSITGIHSKGFIKNFIKTPYKVSLFPDDLLLKPYKLVLYFPARRTYLLNSFTYLMVSSLVFSLLIAFAFAGTVIMLLKQKKISDVKTDFINNLTHEFKTPIATMSVALDSIENPRVINDPDKIKSITKVMREENIRMNSHVEQVLQMALLDNNEIHLNMEPLDVHELLTRSVDCIRLQVESRDGSTSTMFHAVRCIVLADELHLYNVFMNVLDNALKYSQDKPELAISTCNNEEKLEIQIADKGIGMSRDVQKKIFEKFYRVPTGNIHTVKGFGLGLSYSKAITVAHGGEMAVSSVKGEGSRFTIKLPLIKENGIG